MPISEREANALANFYLGLRKVVFIAGVVVLVAAVLAAFVAAFMLGKNHAEPAKPADSGTAKEQMEKPTAAPRPVRHRRVAPPPEPVIEEGEPGTEKDDNAGATVSPPAPAPEHAAVPVPDAVFVAMV